MLGVKGLRDTEKLCEGFAATSADVISGVLFPAEEQGLGLLVTELFSQVQTKAAGRKFVLFRLPPAPSISMLISVFSPSWPVGIFMEMISQASHQDFANIEIGGWGESKRTGASKGQVHYFGAALPTLVFTCENSSVTCLN